MTDEEQYFETRAEEWEHSRGLSRAQLLKLGAAVPLLAGASRLLSADTAGAARLADPPIAKPLPPEWFVNFGTNAEMRWDPLRPSVTDAERALLRPRPHGTPIIDPASWWLRVFGTGLRGDAAGLTFDARTRAPAADDHPGDRVRRQRPQLLRLASKGRRRRDAVGARRDRGGAWRGVPLVDSVRARGHQARAVDVMPRASTRRGRRAASTTGHVRRPIPSRRRSTTRCVAYEMNGQPLPTTTASRPALIVPAGSGSPTSSGSGRSRSPTAALLAVEHARSTVRPGPTTRTPPSRPRS